MYETFCKDGRVLSDGQFYRPAKSLIRLGPTLVNFNRPFQLLLNELNWKYTSGQESLEQSISPLLMIGRLIKNFDWKFGRLKDFLLSY